MFYCMNQRRRLFTLFPPRGPIAFCLDIPYRIPTDAIVMISRRIARAHQRQRQPVGGIVPLINQCVYHRLDSIDERNPEAKRKEKKLSDSAAVLIPL